MKLSSGHKISKKQLLYFIHFSAENVISFDGEPVQSNRILWISRQIDFTL